MPNIPCPNHPDAEAAIGVMAYGPEGGTTDMCGQCILAWAVAIVEGAGATVTPPGTGAAETAQEAPTGAGSTGGRRSRRQRPQEAPEPATAAQVAGDQEQALQGAEHDRPAGGLEPGPAAAPVRGDGRGAAGLDRRPTQLQADA